MDVVERVGAVDGEADQDHVRVGVRQRSESVVVLLSGGIPQRELDSFTVDDDVRDTANTKRRPVSSDREDRSSTERSRD